MKEFSKIHLNILISVGINSLLVIFAVFVLGSRYATDDDIAMARIAYGLYFEPQTRLVFTCTAFGAMLKCLSNWIDGVNWQLVLYYFSLLYGGIVSFYYVLKKKKRLITVLWLLVVTAFYYSSYVEINFSLVTSMLAFFGYTTLFMGAYDRERTPVFLSTITLIFAMIIRYESFFAFSLFAVFSFGIVFTREIKEEGIKSAVFRYIIPFSIALCIPVILVTVDRLSYRDEAWSKYLEYNDNRSQILDFQSVLQHEDETYFLNLGLKEDMIASLEGWQFNDTDIFNEQLIITMGNDSKKYNPEITLEFLFEALGYSVEKICKLYYFAFGILFLACLTIRKDDDRKGSVHILFIPWIMVLPLIAEISFYLFMNRGLDRVFRTTGLGFWCGIMSLLCCDIFCINKDENIVDKKLVLPVTILLLVLGIGLQTDNLKNFKGFHLVDKSIIDKEYSFTEDGRIYMCDIEAVRVIQDAYGVWQSPSKGSLYNCVELGGWMVNYPELIKKQNALGVPNPYKALAYNDNAYLLTTNDGTLQLEFLRSAYDENIESELIEKHGDLSVYKFSVK